MARVWPVPEQMWRGEPRPGAYVTEGEPHLGADVAGGEPCRGVDVPGVSRRSSSNYPLYTTRLRWQARARFYDCRPSTGWQLPDCGSARLPEARFRVHRSSAQHHVEMSVRLDLYMRAEEREYNPHARAHPTHMCKYEGARVRDA